MLYPMPWLARPRMIKQFLTNLLCGHPRFIRRWTIPKCEMPLYQRPLTAPIRSSHRMESWSPRREKERSIKKLMRVCLSHLPSHPSALMKTPRALWIDHMLLPWLDQPGHLHRNHTGNATRARPPNVSLKPKKLVVTIRVKGGLILFGMRHRCKARFGTRNVVGLITRNRKTSEGRNAIIFRLVAYTFQFLQRRRRRPRIRMTVLNMASSTFQNNQHRREIQWRSSQINPLFHPLQTPLSMGKTQYLTQ